VSGDADKTPAAQNITSLKVSGGGKRSRSWAGPLSRYGVARRPCDGLCLWWRLLLDPAAVLRCSPRRRRRGIEARKPDFRSKEAIGDWLVLVFTVRPQTPTSPKLILILAVELVIVTADFRTIMRP
jgi:hypothetical protein